MKHRPSISTGIICVLSSIIIGSSVGHENSSVSLKSSDINHGGMSLVNCSDILPENYQCTKVENCKSRRRRGNRKFCKWDGESAHVCCLPKSTEEIMAKTHVIKKRHYSNFEDDYKPSMKFIRHNQGWGYDDDSWERPGYNYRKNFHSRFGHEFQPDCDRDSETFYDNENSGKDSRGYEPQCGVLAQEERGRSPAAIVGGSPVSTAASTPWMVAVGQTQDNEETRWFCGGALISRSIVLTAAHCITQRQANLVRVGELDFSTSADLAEPQDSEIESSVIHPNHSRPRHYNDIAIIRLKTPVRYSEYVRPICLPPDDGNTYENATVTLTGWGDTRFGGDRSPILQQVEINVISNSQCNARYGEPETIKSNARTLPRGITDSQICAGDENGGRDACQGDSGGPLVKMEGRRRVVIGLVSSGRGCGSKLYPGIYTRVSSYTNWIRTFL